MKEPRPDIPKLKILSIGGFTIDGKTDGYWSFDGLSDPNSVGHYFSKDWELIGGYTLSELKEISLKPLQGE